MDRRGVAIVLAFGAVGLVVILLAASGGPSGGQPSVCADRDAPFDVDRSGDYNRTTVRLSAANGTHLATVDVRLADTADRRRIGLSETPFLAPGEGMLFVHPSEGRYRYWMKGMAFPIDIVFATADGEITTIHHAATPEQLDGYGDFPGRGRFVLEVARGFTNATGVAVGDCLAVSATVGTDA